MTEYRVKRIGAYYYPVRMRDDGNHEEIRNPRHGGPLNYRHKSSALRWIKKQERSE